MSGRITFLLIASMLWANTGWCQDNLVVNGGFEQNSGCWDSNLGWSFPYCVGWESLHGTPDYFHRCASGLWALPTNYDGFQEPYNLTDSAYAGLLTYTTWFAGAQESMIGSLSEPLSVGTKYRIRMKVSVADGVGYMTCCVGITFTSPPFPPYSENLCDVELQIPSEALDTSVWYQLDTVFTFQGGNGGQNFYIGSFRPEELSFPTIIGDTTSSESKVAYFYIDDVEIFEDTLTGIAENELHQVNVNVDPISQKIVADGGLEDVVIELYDMAGKLLATGERYMSTSGLAGLFVVRVMDRKGNMLGVKKVVLGL